MQDHATRHSTRVTSRVTTTNMLNRHRENHADIKTSQGMIYTKAPSAQGAESFIQARQGKARRNHLGGKVALTEVFMVTSAPISYREIHIAVRLG